MKGVRSVSPLGSSQLPISVVAPYASKCIRNVPFLALGLFP